MDPYKTDTLKTFIVAFFVSLTAMVCCAMVTRCAREKYEKTGLTWDQPAVPTWPSIRYQAVPSPVPPLTPPEPATVTR